MPAPSRTLARSAALVSSVLMLAGARAAHGQRTPDIDGRAKEWLDDCRDERHWGERARYCDVKTFDLTGLKALDVDARQNGGVVVRGWDGPNVRVLAKVQTQARSDDRAKELASGIAISTADGRISADNRDGDHWSSSSWSVSYEIWTPREMNLTIEAHNGGISVDAVRGRIDLTTQNGGLTLRGVGGAVRAETTNGGVHVTLAGDRWQGDGLDVRTTNGGVRLEIPRSYSARLETGTVNGGLDVDFPITVQGSIGRRFTTQLGAGGAPIRVQTTNGGVRIAER